MSYYIITIIITILLLGIFSLLRSSSLFSDMGKKIMMLFSCNEHFNGKYGNMCNNDCGSKTMGQCLECADCGYCINDFSSQCVPGDVHGPYNGSCKKWYQNDPFTRAVLSNDNNHINDDDEIFDVPRSFGSRSYI